MTKRIEHGDYPDIRDQKSRAAATTVVRRQLQLMAPDDREQRQRVRQILEELQRGQDDPEVRDPIPFDLFATDEKNTSFALVARDRLVVSRQRRADDADPSSALIASGRLPIEGYERVESGVGGGENFGHDRLGTDVYRSLTRKAPAQLADDARRLRSLGVTASLEFIVPLGHIIKGDDFPEVALPPCPAFPSQKLATSQDSGCGSPRVVVAVVDTGITAEVRTDGWLTDVARGPADIDQTDIMAPVNRLDWFAGHGTFTAGIVQQVAPSSEISVFRFTTGDGIGTDRDLADALIRAAHLADDPNVRLVINMSVGTPGVGGLAPLALQEAVEFVAAQYPDVVMVASAGNNGTDEKMYPAAFDQVVGVAAVKADLQPAAFSSFGSWVTCSCVGAGVVSTFVEGVMPPEPLAGEPDAVFGPDAFAVWSGTSFTAPQISGAIARLCQMNDCSPPRALEILLEDKKPLDGFGLLVDVLLPGTPE